MTQTFGPYSPYRVAGDYVFISGHVGVVPSTGQAPEGPTAQTKQVLNNMKLTLQSGGLHMCDIVKTTIYVTDISSFNAVNDVYVTYFDEPRPARATVGVKELPNVGGDQPIVVEIEAVAYKPKVA